jgi:hypothetical protein
MRCDGSNCAKNDKRNAKCFEDENNHTLIVILWKLGKPTVVLKEAAADIWVIEDVAVICARFLAKSQRSILLILKG